MALYCFLLQKSLLSICASVHSFFDVFLQRRERPAWESRGWAEGKLARPYTNRRCLSSLPYQAMINLPFLGVPQPPLAMLAHSSPSKWSSLAAFPNPGLLSGSRLSSPSARIAPQTPLKHPTTLLSCIFKTQMTLCLRHSSYGPDWSQTIPHPGVLC